ncbi:MAG: translocation/assembly module TamB domain-containing protein [Nonlabens sp.]
MAEETSKEEKNKKPRKFRWLRRILRTIAGIIIFLLLVIAFIRSPWGQDIIVNQLVSYVEGKTGTEVQVDGLYFTFDGDIQANGVYLEDTKGDTLIYSKSLNADIPLIPIISGGGISIDNVEWGGLVARIKRKDTVEGFNFQFLADAFATAPDTTSSKPLNLSFGSGDLRDFDVIFDDAVTGMKADVDFEHLSISMDQLDLDNMKYNVDELLIENAQVEYFMNQPMVQSNEAEQESQEESTLPFLAAQNIRLSKVDFLFESEIDGIRVDTYIDDLETSIPKLDLQNAVYELTLLDLKNSRIDVAMSTSVSETSTASSGSATAFEWPPLEYKAENLNLENVDFTYSVNGAQPEVGVFNPDAVFIEDIDLQSSSISLKNKTLLANIESLSGNEASGLTLYNLELTGRVDEQKLEINSLAVNLNKNTLNGNLSLGYPSINKFINNPTNIDVQANIPNFNLDLADVYRFQPSLKEQPYYDALTAHRMQGNLVATGSTQFLNIPKVQVNWGDETELYATGYLENITSPDDLYYNFERARAQSTRSDLVKIVDEKALGVELPQNVELVGSFIGSTTSLKTDSKLTTSLGNVDADGSFSFGNAITFDAVVKAKQIELGKIMQNPSLGKLTMSVDAEGSGSTINELDASIQSNIASFSYNDYQINNVPISAQIKNGKGDLQTRYKDDNINLDLAATVDLDSVATKATVDLNVIGVDLQEFGVASQNVKAAGKVNATFQGNLDQYTIDATINDGIAVFDQQSYLLGKLQANAFVKPDTTSVDVKNKMLDLKLRSNSDPGSIASGIQRHIDYYLTQKPINDSIKPVKMELKGTISQAPILREVILPSLESLDTISLSVDFNERKHRLDTDIVIPYLKYAGSVVDSIQITSSSAVDRFDFAVSYERLEAGPVRLKQTKLEGVVADNTLALDFISYDESEKLMHFGSTLSRKRDQLGVDNLIFNLSVDDLVFNRKPWTIPETNEMAYGEEKIKFKDFVLSNGKQKLEVRSDIPESEKDHVAFLMENFKLQTLLSYINPDEKLATGVVNGRLVLEDVLGKMGFLADLTIDNLSVLETPLGILDLKAESLDGSEYAMDMSVQGEHMDLLLDGNYTVAQTAAQLDLNLDINRLDMSTISSLSQDFIKDGSGSVSGNVTLKGTTLDPVYEGKFEFNNAGFNVAMLNNKFTLKDERVQLNNDAITLNNFEIRDEKNNVFSIDGQIGTKDIFTPTFDLKLKARNFTALNSTAKDNDLYYGVATFDADATITGNIDVPKIDMKVKVDDRTNFTYVIPAAELDVVQQEGIVQFVNKKNPDAILTQTEEVSATLTGFDLDMDISINKGAKVNIIVDPATGDNLQVSGKGDLKYKMYPNGRMTLAGRYVIADGFYELSFYDIVTRKFNLAKGGSVSWSGDPFDAILDVKAIYRVETSASALMATQTSGSSIEDQNRFRREFPFLVYLNVDGELMKPEISFKLDLPEDAKGSAGGQLYSRVQQVNSQEQELNKQVFSLITLNRFFPTSGSDGSSGGSANIARDNINQALSDQLNQFGGQLLGDTGVDLNFGVDSYTDYQGNSAQTRTQLDVTASKKLLDDRLIVSVGSEVDVQGSSPDGQQTPLIGNVALEYLITPQGRWRFKGFRRNQFDNVIDGQLIVSGVALIFTREFNKFSNLFKSDETFEEINDQETLKEEPKARKEEEETGNTSEDQKSKSNKKE